MIDAQQTPQTTTELWNILYFPFVEKPGGAWFLCDDNWTLTTRGYDSMTYMRCQLGYCFSDGSKPVIPGGIKLKVTFDELQAIRGQCQRNWSTIEEDLVPMPLSVEHARTCAEFIAAPLLTEMMTSKFSTHCAAFRSLDWTNQEHQQIENRIRDVLIDEITTKLQAVHRS